MRNVGNFWKEDMKKIKIGAVLARPVGRLEPVRSFCELHL